MSNIKKIFAAVVVLFVCFAPLVSRAQANDAVALTITPPFFEFNANPGDSWSSSIRVVNTNPGSLPV
ncbi:MAG TPA: hypothetical protein VNG29_04000, partial [Candidatus Paceibacterota bacterium]|nr:hypothetical protein [Candidatus Paceibacterota bacterium]